jgi:hypothetical protein
MDAVAVAVAQGASARPVVRGWSRRAGKKASNEASTLSRTVIPTAVAALSGSGSASGSVESPHPAAPRARAPRMSVYQ